LRTRVATLSQHLFYWPPTSRFGAAAGICEWISRDRQSGRGHLEIKTSAARGEVYVDVAVSFAQPMVTDARGRVLRVSVERRRVERFGSRASPRFALFGAPTLATAGLINSSPVLDPVLQSDARRLVRPDGHLEPRRAAIPISLFCSR